MEIMSNEVSPTRLKNFNPGTAFGGVDKGDAGQQDFRTSNIE
jgi:hypothetical protein